MLAKMPYTTDDSKTCFFFVDGQTIRLYLPLLLTAGSEYKVSVAALSHVFLDTDVPSFLISDEGSVDFRAGTHRSYYDRIT